MITTSTSQGGIYFSLFYFLSILFAFACFLWMIHRNKLPVIPYMLTFFSATLFMLIGTKLFAYTSAEWLFVFENHVFPFTDHKTVLGGIAGAMFGLLIAKKTFGLHESLLDRFAVLLPVGMAIQRFGCLFAGCCFGNATTLPWGITYGKDSIAYRLQVREGLISSDAIASLPVHPDQLYHIIFCSLIALIIWKKSNFLKANGNKFLFSVLLYLVFRFFEEFTRFSFPQSESILLYGLKSLQWILVAVITCMASIIFLRERFNKIPAAGKVIPASFRTEIIVTTIFIGIILLAGEWFIPIERIILWFIIIPVTLIAAWKLISLLTISRTYRISSTLILLAIVFSSQTSTQAPKDSLASYFTLTASAFSGKFIHFHENPVIIGTGCHLGGNDYRNRERYSNNYSGAAIGFHYTEWLSEYGRLNVGFNAALGNNTEHSTDSMQHPSIHQVFTDLNPLCKMDFHWAGFGLGLHAGSGYFIDNSKATQKITPSYSVRLGPINVFFLEYAHADGVSGLCEQTDEWSIGSYFGQKDFYIKIGNVSSATAIQMQFPVADDWLIEPYFRFGNAKPTYDNYTDHQSGPAYMISVKYKIMKKYHPY